LYKTALTSSGLRAQVVAVGIDGRPSTAIEGLPIRSSAEELRMMAAAE